MSTLPKGRKTHENKYTKNITETITKRRHQKKKKTKKAVFQQQNENTKYRKKKQINRPIRDRMSPRFHTYFQPKLGYILYVFKAWCWLSNGDESLCSSSYLNRGNKLLQNNVNLKYLPVDNVFVQEVHHPILLLTIGENKNTFKKFETSKEGTHAK